MLYAIIGHDGDDGLEKRAAARPRHVSYVHSLLEQGRVVFAGPHPAIDSPDPGPAGYTGSLIIGEFDSLEDARAWAENDPYLLEGVFQSVEVKPVLKTLP